MVISVPPRPAFASLNELLSIFITWYWFSVDNPVIILPSVEYTTLSPLLNPWFLNIIESDSDDIPEDLTINFLLAYPSPLFKIVTPDSVFVGPILSLCVPELFNPLKASVLIPAT